MNQPRYAIQPKGPSFIFKRLDESGGTAFASLGEAIRYANSLPQIKGGMVVLLSEKGTGGITLQLEK